MDGAVSGVPDQIPRRRGRLHNPVPLGAVLCRQAGTPGPETSAAVHRVVAGGRDVITVKGVWSCLYHVVDSLGQIIDLLLSARRIPVRQSASSPRRWLRRTA